jgi:glucan 1,3-beta-glucosidase
VLEPWITPSIFENTGNDDIVDEFTFGQLQDPDVALKALQSHWETWITEEDFANMSAAGLNHIR